MTKQPPRALCSIAAAIILATTVLGSGAPQDAEAGAPPGLPNTPVTRFATLPPNIPGNPEGMTSDSSGNIYANSFNTGVPCATTTPPSDNLKAGVEAYMGARSGGKATASAIPNGTPNNIFVWDASGNLKSQTPFIGCEGGFMATPLGMQPIGNQLFVIDVFTGTVYRYNLPLTNTSQPDRSYSICGGFFAAFGPNPSAFCALNDMKLGPDGRLYMADNGAGPAFVFSNCCLTGRIFVLDPVSGASSVWYTNPALNVIGEPEFGVVSNVFSLDGKTLYMSNFGSDFIYSIQVAAQNPNLPPSLSNPLATPTSPLNVVYHNSSIIAGPNHLAFDNAGRMWVTGGENNTVVALQVTPNGPSQAVASAGTYCGFAPDGAPGCLLQPASPVFANGIMYVGNESNPGLSPRDTDLPPTDPAWTTTLKLYTITKFTPPPGGPAGKAFGVSASSGKVLLSWSGGVNPSGFNYARLSNGVVTVNPTNGLLPANTTSVVDASPGSGLNCYWLFPQQLGRSGLSSDLACATIGIQNGDAPQDFTIELNQSFTATLSWTAPSRGAPTGYQLATIGDGIQQLSTSTTSAQIPINGFSCFLIQAVTNGVVTGTAEAVCAQPGFSNVQQ